MSRLRYLSVLLFSLAVAGMSAAPSASFAASPLKFADQNAENSWGATHGIKPWLKQLEEASQGAIAIDLYANQSLAKGSQSWSATRKGIADMSWNAMAMYPGMNPLAEAITLPGLPYSTPMETSAVLWDMYEKFPALAAPYKDNKILALFTSDMFNLVTVKPVRTLEDLKGMKIRTVAGPLVHALEALGAVPVVIPMPDVYLGLQRGTIDGTLASWEPYNGFRFYEVAKHVITNAPFGVSFFTVAMNKKAYDRLPPAGKAAIDANSGKSASVWLAEHFSFSSRQVRDDLRARGVDIDTYELPPAELARWVEAGAHPVWTQWTETRGKRAMPTPPPCWIS